MSRLGIAVLLATGALFPCASLADWSGRQGGFTVAQTEQDITVTSGTTAGIAFSARTFAAAQYKELLAEFEQPAPGPDGASPLWVRHRFWIVSLAGPYLGLRDEVEIEMGHSAIPAGRARFWTIDLRLGARYGFDADDPLSASANAPGAIVDLRRLVTEPEIAEAVAGSTLAHIAPKPAGPGFKQAMYALSRIATTGGNCFEASLQATTSFAIVRVAPGLGVQLGLPGQSSCRDKLTVVDLNFQAPAPSLASILMAPAVAPETIIEQGTIPK